MSFSRVVVLVTATAGLVFLFLLWKQGHEQQRREELAECQRTAAHGGRFAECLEERYGWSERDVANAFIDYIGEKYPRP